MRYIFFLSVFFLLVQSILAQNVGIGTTAPKARLHVADSAVLFSGPASLPSVPGAPPVTGSGTRMMWYPDKAAFRAGTVTGTLWDETSVGKYSVSFGLNNKAAGDYAASTGWGNTSSGNGSFTAGFSNTASGNYSTALGNNTDASAYGSLVIGRYNVQNGNANSWVDTDPLFVIGNGYTYDPGNGTQVIQRRNAFSVKKSGETNINGMAKLNDDLAVSGKSSFNDTVRLNRNVGINLAPDEIPATSLMLNGAITLRPSYATISAANNYTIDIVNKTVIKVHNYDNTLPTLKIGNGGWYGQVIILLSSGYAFKVASNSDPGSVWVSVPSTRTLGGNITLLFMDGVWQEISCTQF